MREHSCSQECPCGHWGPRVVQRGSRGRVTLDVYDGSHDHDANVYKTYEPEEDE